MKKLTVLILGVLCCGCSKVDLTRGDFAPPYSVRIGGFSQELTLQPADPLTASVQKWIQTNSSGWSKSMLTYAPGVVVRNDHFSLNFLEGAAVLNFKLDSKKNKWVQVVKDCELDGLAFLAELENQHKEKAEPTLPHVQK